MRRQSVYGPWFLDTRAAHYQIDYIPVGGSGDPDLIAMPTPMPHAAEPANEQMFNGILASFTPTPATPIVC